MFQNVQDVFAARLAILVENEKLEAGEANIAVRAIQVLFEQSDEDLVIALENAMWMDKTVHEVGHPAPHMAPGEPLGMGYVRRDGELVAVDHAGKVVEGVDNDGLTDAEAAAALDEQSTWPQDEFGREIDPGLKR